MTDSADPKSSVDGNEPDGSGDLAGPEQQATRRQRMALVIGGVAILALAIIAMIWLLSDDTSDDDAVIGKTTDGSAEETTTTPEITTSTTTAEPTTAVRVPGEPPLRTDSVSGSGCRVGPGALPDGWWYGTIDPPVSSTITFDLTCYYLGDAAEEEAAKRNDEVNNDYYVVNDSAEVRSVPVASDATASCVTLGSGVK